MPWMQKAGAEPARSMWAALTPDLRAPEALLPSAMLPFVLATLVINLYLLRLLAGAKLLFLNHRQAFAVAPVVCVVYLVLGFRALDGWCGSIGLNASCPAKLHSTRPDVTSDAMASVPSALFACLLLQGGMQYLISQLGARAKFGFMVLPCIGVHACTLLYYLQEQMAGPCTLTTWYGKEFRPFHFFLWINSISLQAFTLAGLALEVTQQAAPNKALAQQERPALVERSAHWAAMASVSAQCMCWAGAVSEATHHASPWVNRGLMALCFGSFYCLLYAISQPLNICIDAMARSPDTVKRFRAIKAYILCGYHSFPLVWALGYGGVLSDSGVRFAFMCCDVGAKFLPVSLYISTMTSE